MTILITQVDKILAVISSIGILIVSIIILNTPPASVYELTIYDAYPFGLWFFISVSIISGILILIRNSLSSEPSRWWMAGLGLVILSNFILLGLPSFRGYGFWPAGDGLTHIGMMKDIILTGHFGDQNYYPVLHLLGASLLEVTGLTETGVANLILITWNILFLTGTYLLSLVITDNKRKALLITALASPLIFSHLHVLIHPSVGSILLMPLLFYFVFKSKYLYIYRKSYIALSILLSIVIVYMHPVSCLYAIIILVTFNVASTLYKRFNKAENDIDARTFPTLSSYNLPLIMFIVFCGWYLSNSSLEWNIRAVYLFLSQENAESLFGVQTGFLNTANISFWQTINLFINKYGAIFAYFGLSIIAGISIFLLVIKRKMLYGESSFIFVGALVVAFAASAFSLWGFTGELDPTRVARFAILITPIIIGLLFSNLLQNRILYGFLTIIIIAVSILSVLNVYGSPRTIELNLQVTRMQIAGTGWFLNNQNKNIMAVDINGDLYRYEDFHFGYQTRPFDRAQVYPSVMPTQFGYDQNSSLPETIDSDSAYLLTSKSSRVNIMVVPENVRHKARDYGNQGFARLMTDPSVNLIYVNGEFEAWKVYER
ncbi:MAG: hypothetical protein PHU23_02995 [Dehalococcoidales bacterium]|nr:hypothetical protein [Dehalococcoidales bacterium]